MWRMNMAIRHILKIPVAKIVPRLCLTQFRIHENFKRYILGQILSVSSMVLIEKCELNS